MAWHAQAGSWQHLLCLFETCSHPIVQVSQYLLSGSSDGAFTPVCPSLAALSTALPLQSMPRDEVIEPSPPDGKMGCISLFQAAHVGVAHKKFLRLGKPAAGSSFRVSFWGWLTAGAQGPVHVGRGEAYYFFCLLAF